MSENAGLGQKTLFLGGHLNGDLPTPMHPLPLADVVFGDRQGSDLFCFRSLQLVHARGELLVVGGKEHCGLRLHHLDHGVQQPGVI